MGHDDDDLLQTTVKHNEEQSMWTKPGALS